MIKHIYRQVFKYSLISQYRSEDESATFTHFGMPYLYRMFSGFHKKLGVKNTLIISKLHY
jgi:hypothetical protein